MQTDNEIKDIVGGWIDDKVSNIHTALRGKIVEYNPATNRANVQPVGTYQTADYRELAYPVIYNVPVQFPIGMGGNAGCTFPLSAGDGCLLVFAERQTDNFISKNNNSDDIRTHSLNDALCIPGLYTDATQSNIEHSGSVCLFNGGSMVQLTGGGFSGMLADGTSFSFGGGDLVVNGISLVHHTHGNVENGGGNTGQPQ